MSLQHVRILQGRSLFAEIADDCVKCKRIRRKYIEARMGPLQDCQLSISPVFYDTLVDLWGPMQVFCPGYERVTRGRTKEYKIWVMVFACAATGTVSTQIIEGRDVESMLCGFNRFFVECCVPKMVFCDKEGGIMKALNEGELDIMDLEGRLHHEQGIQFETCPAQAHSAHGRIERRIRLLQDAFTRSNMTANRLHATGWMTVTKLLERDVNSLPLGYLTHTGDETALNQILTPAMLKLNGLSKRAPVGIFTLPDNCQGLMKKVEDVYSLWYKIFSTAYVPQLMDRDKWMKNDDNVQVHDIVYFKLLDSPLGATWRIGKIESVKLGRDGVCRVVCVAYSNSRGDCQVVERSVRDVVRLFNVEDTSLMDRMQEVHHLADKLRSTNSLMRDFSIPEQSFIAAHSQMPQVLKETQMPDHEWFEDEMDKLEDFLNIDEQEGVLLL